MSETERNFHMRGAFQAYSYTAKWESKDCMHELSFPRGRKLNNIKYSIKAIKRRKRDNNKKEWRIRAINRNSDRYDRY